MASEGDYLREVSPGETLESIPRDAYNELVRLANAARGNRGKVGAGIANFARDTTLVTVRNNSSVDIERFGILELNAPITTPGDNLDEFVRMPCFDGVVPTATDVPFCVLLEPLVANAIGKGVVAGIIPCQITGSAGAASAGPAATIHATLTAGSGSARVIYQEAGSGTRWAIVLLNGAAAAALVAHPYVTKGLVSHNFQRYGGHKLYNNSLSVYPGTRIAGAPVGSDVVDMIEGNAGWLGLNTLFDGSSIIPPFGPDNSTAAFSPWTDETPAVQQYDAIIHVDSNQPVSPATTGPNIGLVTIRAQKPRNTSGGGGDDHIDVFIGQGAGGWIGAGSAILGIAVDSYSSEAQSRYSIRHAASGFWHHGVTTAALAVAGLTFTGGILVGGTFSLSAYSFGGVPSGTYNLAGTY